MSNLDTASIQFILFGLAVACISNMSRAVAWRSAVLLVASLVFIGLIARDPIMLLPLAAFVTLGYLSIVLLRSGRSRMLSLILTASILVYIWLKKYTFLPDVIFLHSPYLTLGLSYIFFRVLHLQIETAEGMEERKISLARYLQYTLNFTTFVSGPIQRYDDYARDQFAPEPVPLGICAIGTQLERIVRGFFKVNVLATMLLEFHQDALAQVTSPFPVAVKIYAAFQVVLIYPLFLYCNFSGYIDIVIALARLMRVRLPENFDRPFSASSVLDFWNQWHITLSNWLKSYVYNPLLLALMRRNPLPSVEPLLGVFCFFVTFFLIGVWHGRTSEFIVFGLLTGAGMSLNKLWQLALTRAMGRKKYKTLAANGAYESLGRGLNYVWFGFTLFWFWGDWKHIDTLFGSINAVEWTGVLLSALLLAATVLMLWEWLRAVLLSPRTSDGPILLSRYARTVYVSALGLVSLVFVLLMNQPVPAIVYKAF